ncbi:hypothetical protein [Amycolatopsis sp. YIM 10]|uniref:hypothetical protein n=1 Tax=Amycolatopsis sp. YIM 10 TaxID=2653857 RepID=UPI00128FE9ED|nr:hypothetical protein [Amycolatopsis sp. YIM 10]QFU90575.1 hypothetical protein YIM_27005 [Amycolatopsis sp. YIM 10]
MARTPNTRVIVYLGIVVYLLGQAFDTYWHQRNVSFVPEPPSELWRIHAGIYGGAVILTLAGVWLALRPGGRVTGLLLVAGGLTQLTGFFGDMWLHARGESIDFWHDLVWYGLAVIVIGVVRMEALNRNRPEPAEAG